jgi:coatomer protein complex subunit alpha (xenin)
MTEDDLPPPPQNSGHSTLAPPAVKFVQSDSNWPIKNLGESFFDRALANGSTEGFTGQDPSSTNANGNGDKDQLDAWANDVDAEDGGAGDGEDEDEGWDLDAEVIDIPEEVDEEVTATGGGGEEADLSEGVSPGVKEDDMWIRNSPLAADHAAAGAFESAMQVS